ncbi:MAG: hypothetical protein KDB01_09590 [Planctomycetaceae bacterium]|nr:hypothetical protein [Planctomycetaceae bacterium]
MKAILTITLITLLAVQAFAERTLPAPDIALLQAPTPVYEPTPADADSVPAPSAPAVVLESYPADPLMPVAPIDLFQRVKVRNPRRIHPCAVPTIVTVQDPCDHCCTVNVEVCMPPCDNPEVRCSRLGNRVVYDFGKHKITLISRLGIVIVDYH